MKLTTQLHLVLTLRMNGAIPPRSLYAFTVYIRTTSPLTFFPAKSHFIAVACLLISVGVNVTPLNAFMGPVVSLTILTMEMETKSYVKLDEGGGEVFWEPQKIPVRLQLWIILFLSLSSPEFKATLCTIRYADCRSTRGFVHSISCNRSTVPHLSISFQTLKYGE